VTTFPPVTVGVGMMPLMVGVGVGVTPLMVGVGVGVTPLMVGVGVGASSISQSPFVMVLWSSVTAPFRANNCPCIVAPVCAAMDVNAKMCPTKKESVPNVAELVTFQKTRQYRAPFSRIILLPDAVLSVEPD